MQVWKYFHSRQIFDGVRQRSTKTRCLKFHIDRSNFKGKNEGRDSKVSIAVAVSLENGKDPIFQLKGGLWKKRKEIRSEILFFHKGEYVRISGNIGKQKNNKNKKK